MGVGRWAWKHSTTRSLLQKSPPRKPVLRTPAI